MNRIAAGMDDQEAARLALAPLLYAVQPFDPGAVALASLIVLCTGAAAAYIPARRASHLDLLSVMRGD